MITSCVPVTLLADLRHDCFRRGGETADELEWTL